MLVFLAQRYLWKTLKKKENGKNFNFSIDYNKENLLSFTIDIRGMRSVDALDF